MAKSNRIRGAGTGQLPVRAGTQSVERTLHLLREICTRSSSGWQFADLARHCGLEKSTARRILKCLLQERMISRRSRDGHFLPGPMIFELSISLPSYAAFQRAGAERVTALAKRTRGIASLYLRSGDDYVCIAQTAGSSATGLVSVQIGSRHPLALTTGGLAILAALKRDEARRVIERNFAYLERVGAVRIAAIKRALQASQAAGFGISEGLFLPGINAVAVAIRNRNGDVFAAISIAGPGDKFPLSRLPAIRQLLESEAANLTADSADLFPEESAHVSGRHIVA